MPESLPAHLAFPLTVEAYMAACLYHPQLGYYTRGLNFTDPTAPKGRDFTTAPLLTPLFGATLANWVATQWNLLCSNTPTRQHPFILAEAGPGGGQLMHSLLAQLHTAHPACYAACQPWLVETSPALTTLQQSTLAEFPQCQWSTTLPFQHANTPTFLLANELLDAFPIRQFAGTTERTVLRHPDGALAFSHPDDAVTREDSPALTHWLTTLKGHANLATALLIDYGYTHILTSTTPPLQHSTLQAMHRHHKVSPLHLPGESDLTAHVNFAHVAATLGNDHCTLTDLAPFLLRHGLLNLAESSISSAETASSLHRLMHPASMGTLFKVLEYKA